MVSPLHAALSLHRCQVWNVGVQGHIDKSNFTNSCSNQSAMDVSLISLTLSCSGPAEAALSLLDIAKGVAALVAERLVAWRTRCWLVGALTIA